MRRSESEERGGEKEKMSREFDEEAKEKPRRDQQSKKEQNEDEN